MCSRRTVGEEKREGKRKKKGKKKVRSLDSRLRGNDVVCGKKKRGRERKGKKKVRGLDSRLRGNDRRVGMVDETGMAEVSGVTGKTLYYNPPTSNIFSWKFTPIPVSWVP